jgi:hypothetical protein
MLDHGVLWFAWDVRVRDLDEKLDLKTLNKKGSDSVTLAKDSREGESSTKPERHVIYKAYQAIPRYVIHYKLVAHSKEVSLNNFGKEQADANGICRISLTPNSSFKGDSAEEYHYRMAESQFFRMSSTRKCKVIMFF